MEISPREKCSMGIRERILRVAWKQLINYETISEHLQNFILNVRCDI